MTSRRELRRSRCSRRSQFVHGSPRGPHRAHHRLAHRQRRQRPALDGKARRFRRSTRRTASVKSVPALVIHGTADEVVPYENGKLLARGLPNADFITVHGGPHLLFIEETSASTHRYRSSSTMSELGPGTPHVGRAWSERRAALTPDREGWWMRPPASGHVAELDRRANRTARLLRRYGVGDSGESTGTVAVVSRNRPAVVDLFFASAKTGSRLAPLSHRLRPRNSPNSSTASTRNSSLSRLPPPRLSRQLWRQPIRRLSRLIHLGTAADRRPRLPRSTARPRAALLEDAHASRRNAGPQRHTSPPAHRWVDWNATGDGTNPPRHRLEPSEYDYGRGLREDDVTPMVFPMFHTGGWNVLTVPRGTGGRGHAGECPATSRFRTRCRRTPSRTTTTSTPCWPLSTGARRTSRRSPSTDRPDPSAKRAGVVVGPGRRPLTGVRPHRARAATAMPEDWPHAKADSVGAGATRRRQSRRTRDSDDEGSPAGSRDPVDPGTVGELQLRSPHAAAGYLDNPDATAETFGDGWVSTGDLARVDADGYYYIEGRTSTCSSAAARTSFPRRSRTLRRPPHGRRRRRDSGPRRPMGAGRKASSSPHPLL